MKKHLHLLIAGIAIAIVMVNLQSCTSYRGIASKPDGHNHYRPDFASLRIIKHHHNDHLKAKTDNTSTAANTIATPAEPAKKPAPKFIAQVTGDAPFKARVPNIITKDMDDDQMQKANEVLAKYSNHKVSLSKNARGKVFLKADSRKDFVKLTRTLIKESKSAAPMSDEARDILALVGGILGIVSIGLCLIPYVDYISIPAGVAGIVLGALGLHSERRHKWALLGIILGAIGVFLALVFIILYLYLLFGVL